MTGLNLGMVIEIIVAALLVLTIAYCMILNTRLTRLRADEEVLRATIAELITATEIAERAILGLKATASDCEKTLGGRLTSADAAISELDRKIALGDDVLRRLVAAASGRGGESHREAPPMRTPEPQRLAAPAYREPEPAYHQPEPAYRQPEPQPRREPEPAYRQPAQRPAPPATPGYGFAMAQPAPQPQPAYYGYDEPEAPASYAPQPQPQQAYAPTPAPAREPVSRSLQAAAEAAAERLSAYRRAQREEAA